MACAALLASITPARQLPCPLKFNSIDIVIPTQLSARLAVAMPKRLSRSHGSLVLLSVFSFIAAASSFPYYFVERHSTSCTDHPSHGFTAAHGGPGALAKADAGISFKVSPYSGGAAAARVCTGALYDVQIAYGNDQARHALATTSQGAFDGSDASCLGRAYSAEALSLWKLRLEVPCDADGSVELKVTSAAAQTDSYRTSSLTLPVDSTCAAAGMGHR